MNVPIVKTAAEIIRTASPEHPADSVLRNVLKKKSGLLRLESREISRAVFSYYRWLGWLNTTAPIEEQITEAGQLALRFSHDPAAISDAIKAVPSWTRECLVLSPAWLSTLQQEPTLWLRTHRGSAQELLAKLNSSKAGPLPDSIEFQGETDLFRTAEFHDGKFELQDINSQAVGMICDPQPGETWWDACAGEGGKTLHLSDLMGNKGLIWATDKVEWRLKQLKLRAGRAHCFNYRAKVWQGLGTLPTKTLFDGVLLDAPCSGIGTWQRNPHARWTTMLKDVNELADLQRDLLMQASAAVKIGGRLIYSVCTLSRQETEAIANDFDKAHPEYEPAPFSNPFSPSTAKVTRLVLWPQDNRGNGMFIAVWKRMAK